MNTVINPNILGINYAWFFQDFPKNPVIIYDSLKKINKFNGLQVSTTFQGIDIPNDFPNEMPLYQLISDNINVKISRARLDLSFKFIHNLNIKTILEITSDVSKLIAKLRNIIRIGVFSDMFVDSSEISPINFFENKFIRKNIIKNPYEINFKYNIRDFFQQKELNKIFSFDKVSNFNINNEQKDDILIRKDINSVVTNEILSIDFILDFITEFSEKVIDFK